MKNSWNIIQKQTVLDRNHVRVEEWTMKTHRGTERTFDIGIFSDAVMVIGFTSDDRWIIISQYLIAAQEHRFGTVAGFVEQGENPIAAAQREFLEETGYDAKEYVFLGSTMRDKWETGMFHFYLAKGAFQVGPQQLEEAEDISVHVVETNQLIELLETNQIHDVGSVACTEKALRNILPVIKQ